MITSEEIKLENYKKQIEILKEKIESSSNNLILQEDYKKEILKIKKQLFIEIRQCVQDAAFLVRNKYTKILFKEALRKISSYTAFYFKYF